MKLDQRIYHPESGRFGRITRVAQCGRSAPYLRYGIELDDGSQWAVGEDSIIPAFTPRQVDRTPSDVEPPRGSAA